MRVKPYVEPAGLEELLVNIDCAPSMGNLVVCSAKQKQALKALTEVRHARDNAIRESLWDKATELGRELFLLAREYVYDFFPTPEEYEIRSSDRSQ